MDHYQRLGRGGVTRGKLPHRAPQLTRLTIDPEPSLAPKVGIAELLRQRQGRPRTRSLTIHKHEDVSFCDSLSASELHVNCLAPLLRNAALAGRGAAQVTPE